MGPNASAVRVAVDDLLTAQDGSRATSAQPLPTPCVSRSALNRRAVTRGEAEEVEVDSPIGKGVQVVRTP